jgi:hypothetical protein
MDRLTLIKDGFIKINKAYLWASRNAQNRQADYQTLLDRLELIYRELEALGVNKTISTSLFLFGGVLTVDFVEQFKDEPKLGT